MKDIVKTLDMKFKLLAVINRDYEAMLEREKERKYTGRVKDISKDFRGNIRSENQSIEHKVTADGK